MSTTSKAVKCELSDNIFQGDIFQNVRFNYLESEDNDSVEVIEYVFPYAIVLSQSCDVISMSEMEVSKTGKATKFMPSILMCPIYDTTLAKQGEHICDALELMNIAIVKDNLFNSHEKKVADKDWHYRFHSLEIEYEGNIALDNSMIDFKHYFTVPISYLLHNRSDRVFRLDDIYAEQITLKFATFLSRVAMPD